MGQENAYNFLKGKDWTTSKEVADALNVGQKTTARSLNILVRSGVVERKFTQHDSKYYYKIKGE